MADDTMPNLLGMTRAALYLADDSSWMLSDGVYHHVPDRPVNRIVAMARRAGMSKRDGLGLALIAGMLICCANASVGEVVTLPPVLCKVQWGKVSVLGIHAGRFWHAVHNELASVAAQQGWI
jgi:hypothetical protein